MVSRCFLQLNFHVLPATAKPHVSCPPKKTLSLRKILLKQDKCQIIKSPSLSLNLTSTSLGHPFQTLGSSLLALTFPLPRAPLISSNPIIPLSRLKCTVPSHSSILLYFQRVEFRQGSSLEGKTALSLVGNRQQCSMEDFHLRHRGHFAS